jgi:hypothetical protein
LAYSVYGVTAAHDDISTLKHQVTTLQGELKTDSSQASAQLSTFGADLANDQSKISTDANSINTLNQQVSSLQALDRPQDPLASYDLICSQDQTNQSTGITQLYYFPCTNEAQTTPLPGA